MTPHEFKERAKRSIPTWVWPLIAGTLLGAVGSGLDYRYFVGSQLSAHSEKIMALEMRINKIENSTVTADLFKEMKEDLDRRLSNIEGRITIHDEETKRELKKKANTVVWGGTIDKAPRPGAPKPKSEKK